MNDNDEDSPNEDDSDDGHVAVCGVASAEAIAASHASGHRFGEELSNRF